MKRTTEKLWRGGGPSGRLEPLCLFGVGGGGRGGGVRARACASELLLGSGSVDGSIGRNVRRSTPAVVSDEVSM